VSAEQLALWSAARIGGMTTDPDEAALGEPFLLEVGPDAWVIVQWELTAKIDTAGTWFPFFWNGPSVPYWRWTGSHGDLPDEAARFVSAEAAAEALAAYQVTHPERVYSPRSV